MGKRKEAKRAYERLMRRKSAAIEWQQAIGYYRRILYDARADWPEVDRAQTIVTWASSLTIPIFGGSFAFAFNKVMVVVEEHTQPLSDPLFYGVNREHNILVIKVPEPKGAGE